MSATTNSVCSSSRTTPRLRLERGERVVGDLRLGRADHADQRALADVGEADEGDVGHQLQLELQPAAPRRARPARRTSAPGGGSTGTWRCPGRHDRRPRRASGRRGGRGRRAARRCTGRWPRCLRERRPPSTRRACRAGPCPCRGRRRSARRWGWSRKASSEATLRSATSHTSPPLPPSPPFGPPSATGPSRRNDDAAGAAVAAAHVQLRLVDEPAAHRTDFRGYPGELDPTPARRRETCSGTHWSYAGPWQGRTSGQSAGRRRCPATRTSPASRLRPRRLVGRQRVGHAARPTPHARTSRPSTSPPWPPRPRRRRPGPSRRSPTRGGRASSATATASCTPSAFRRLAGKTQVFVFPDDHQRTRLTHALEVAQVAVSVARALGLNVALTEAIALGHDCGHGPGGHASEDALSPYVPRRLRPCGVGRRRHPRPAEPVRRDARRHPQPLVEPAGADDAGGRGGQLGRPHRLRLPRLRGRRRRRHRATRRAARPSSAARCGDRRSQQLRHVHHRR